MYKLGWLQPVADGLDDASAEATSLREKADRGSTDRESAGRGRADRENTCRESAKHETADRGSADGGVERGKGKRPRWNSSPSPEEAAAPRSRLKKTGAYEGGAGVPPHPPPWVSRHPTPQASHGSSNSISYVSCPFERVLPLVRSRRVLLRNGKALLAPRQVPAAVVQHFKELLRKGMAVAERGLPGVERDERVKGVLAQVSKKKEKCGVRLEHSHICFVLFWILFRVCPRRVGRGGAGRGDSVVPQGASFREGLCVDLGPPSAMLVEIR